MEPRTPNKGKGVPPLEEPTEVARVGDETGLVPGDYDVAPGTQLGEYEIERPLGKGGMGEVFFAVHPKIGKRAAIKILKKELSNPFNVERFVDEARVVNSIGHPNIVDIFAFGDMPDGRCYYIMELLIGQTLRERIAKGPIAADETCTILKPLTRALDAAHAKGVIHRDLKPDNIFLVDVAGEHPTIKLLDFGIAKLAKSDHRVEQTKSGVMVGTPQYVAPEQAKGHAVDARTDIYALGGIAFEMLTGRPPFEADNAMEMVAKHLMEKPIKPSSVLPSVPPELDALVLAMLQKAPEQRPSLADIALVIDRMKLGPIPLDDVRTLERRDRKVQPPPQVQPQLPSIPRTGTLERRDRGVRPRTDPGVPGVALQTVAPAPSEMYEVEPRSGAHTQVDQPVAAPEHTEKDAITIAGRGKWIALSIIVLVAATLISFVVISSLRSKPVAVVEADAIAVAEIDAAPEIDAAVAVSIDAAVAPIDAVAVARDDAATTIVDAAVIHDAAIAAPDARVVIERPQVRKGRLVIEVNKPPKTITIRINGALVTRNGLIDYPVTLGQTYQVEIRAEGRLPVTFAITPQKPLITKTIDLPLDLIAPK